jgi:predicted dehydrogenase
MTSQQHLSFTAVTAKAPQLRWGILSTAQIARKNWQVIQLAGNSIVTAVASRDLDRSRRFIAECQAQAPMAVVPRAFGGYEDLLACEDVDAVYIPLPTGLRQEWVLRAATAGKHVVCEKPCATSVADLREMVEACRRHQVQFMDGVRFMHSRRLELLRQVLKDGQNVGEIRRIAAAFTFRQAPEFFADNIRTHSSLEPFGCLGDLGWYCLRFALWVMDWQMPLQVAGWLQAEQGRPDSPAAVPTAFCGELFFAGGVSASFYFIFYLKGPKKRGLTVYDKVLTNVACLALHSAWGDTRQAVVDQMKAKASDMQRSTKFTTPLATKTTGPPGGFLTR